LVGNYHFSGKVEEKVIILACVDVHFDFDEAILTKEAQVILKRSIQILKKNP
jgi:outer membrane protein OmpA-like peptidoglycan-associated protein